jgi:hypothetical protein
MQPAKEQRYKFGPMDRLKKLWGLPVSELRSVIGYKSARVARFMKQDWGGRLFGKAWSSGRASNISKLREDIRFFALTGRPGGKQELATVLNEVMGVAPAQICQIADQACDHVFDLLGSGPVVLGKRIDWHRDFKSGIRWDLKHFKRIPEINLEDDSDIKVPWDLSRCHHFVKLGMAYWLTNDEKYAEEFVAQSDDWIAQNPPYFGVNWHCAMEVAIRAINWIWGYYFFRSSNLFDEVRKRNFASSLRVHGTYIWNNLEFNMRVIEGKHRRHNGNHYVADLVGLIYLGVVLPGRIGKRWLEFGIAELGRELESQLLPDGVQWETSPSYHRLVLEMALSAVILCRDNCITIPKAVPTKLEAMCDYVLHYVNPNGLCPLVRDADDGRLHWLNSDSFRDHRHILALGGVFFGRGDMVARSGTRWEDVLWLLGLPGISKASHLLESPTKLESRAFADSGFYVMRDADTSHIFIACADIGMGGLQGGHSHNDCLSFELFFGGHTFITDCGSYTYSGDPQERNRFRSTACHNTARIDTAELNRFDPNALFRLENDAKPRILQWLSRSECDFLSAAHFGYMRLAQPVVHRRDFLLDRVSRCLLISDYFEGEGTHLIEVFFHFSPSVQIEEVHSGSFRASMSDSAISLGFLGGDGWSFRLQQGWVSEGYGRRRNSRSLVAGLRQKVPARLTTAIRLGVGPAANAIQHHGEVLQSVCKRYREVCRVKPGSVIPSPPLH